MALCRLKPRALKLECIEPLAPQTPQILSHFIRRIHVDVSLLIAHTQHSLSTSFLSQVIYISIIKLFP